MADAKCKDKDKKKDKEKKTMSRMDQILHSLSETLEKTEKSDETP